MNGRIEREALWLFGGKHIGSVRMEEQGDFVQIQDATKRWKGMSSTRNISGQTALPRASYVRY